MTELKNVLSTFFYLLTLIFIFKSERSVRQRAVFYGAALILFLCALLSKSVTVTLPVALLLIRAWFTERWERNILLRMLPFIGLALGVGLYTLHYEHHLVGAEGPVWSLNGPQRLKLRISRGQPVINKPLAHRG